MQVRNKISTFTKFAQFLRTHHHRNLQAPRIFGYIFAYKLRTASVYRTGSPLNSVKIHSKYRNKTANCVYREIIHIIYHSNLYLLSPYNRKTYVISPTPLNKRPTRRRFFSYNSQTLDSILFKSLYTEFHSNRKRSVGKTDYCP
jgi:hypothetical protein